jgi:hypothetical protein
MTKDLPHWEPPPPLGKITFLKQVKDFPCGHPGKEGAITHVEKDGSLYCVLTCGHIFVVAPDEVDKIVRVDLADTSNKEEKGKMAKQTKIPNSDGVIQVQGYEAKVKAYKTDYLFYKQLSERVDEAKAEFRGLAKEAEANASGDINQVEFIAEDGSCVPVNLPDVEKQGNRTSISDKSFKAAVQLGGDLNELGVTETEESYTLTGKWVDWIKDVLATNYANKEIPDGLAKREVTRLTVDGIAKLRKMAAEGKTDQERQAARVLLEAGIKDATVKVV